MAHVPRNLALAALLAVPMARAAEPPTLHYTVTPVLAQGDLQAVDVELVGEAGADGKLDVVLPGTQLALSSDGSLSAGEHGHLVLAGAPNAQLTLRYRRRGNDSLQREWDTDPYMAAGWLLAPCSALLAMPADNIARRVEVTWKLPARWRGLTNLPASTPTTTSAQSHSVCFLGRDVTEKVIPLGHGGHLRTYTTDPREAAPLVDLAVRALTIVAADGDGRPADYPVFITSVDREGGGLSSWSQGAGMGMVLERGVAPGGVVAPMITDYRRLLAPGPADPATAWYTEGLRSYQVVSDLLVSHTLDRGIVAAWFDQVSGQYGSSAFRRAPQSQVAAEWSSSPDLQALPMQRGMLFGALLDARLREATRGTATLGDVLRKIGPHPADPTGALIAAVRAAGGGDIAPLYEKYIVRGDLLLLPADALGACMAVRTDADGYGWQVQRVSATCQP